MTKQTEVRVSSRALVTLPDQSVIIFVYKAYKNPGKFDYDLPGGGLEYYESPEQCTIRELKEETNLTGLIGNLICEYDNVLTYFDRFENVEKTVRRIGWIFDVAVRDISSFKLELDTNMYSYITTSRDQAINLLKVNYRDISA